LEGRRGLSSAVESWKRRIFEERRKTADTRRAFGLPRLSFLGFCLLRALRVSAVFFFGWGFRVSCALGVLLGAPGKPGPGRGPSLPAEEIVGEGGWRKMEEINRGGAETRRRKESEKEGEDHPRGPDWLLSSETALCGEDPVRGGNPLFFFFSATPSLRGFSFSWKILRSLDSPASGRPLRPARRLLDPSSNPEGNLPENPRQSHAAHKPWKQLCRATGEKRELAGGGPNPLSFLPLPT